MYLYSLLSNLSGFGPRILILYFMIDTHIFGLWCLRNFNITVILMNLMHSFNIIRYSIGTVAIGNFNFWGKFSLCNNSRFFRLLNRDARDIWLIYPICWIIWSNWIVWLSDSNMAWNYTAILCFYCSLNLLLKFPEYKVNN